MFALKTLITLNSGAFVVLLTFIGNAAANSAFVVPLDALRFAMLCFLIGIATTFVVVAISYVNSITFNPYDLGKGMSDKVAIPVYIIGAVIALVAFVWGVARVVLSVTSP
ncbi:hypothetical protein [Pseudorhodobacter sp.]|uniref:hypothetical protein n=1 Tax=Pseudorhodobacter sp. TaxID=1934400 RepID=UPI00264799CF|nr:hypothetical protein [Pseudorhodobacter sp.]MDN5786965.1 hypothetical protein [Pseudorhodobacter sp.]